MKAVNNGTTSIRFSVQALSRIKEMSEKFNVTQIELFECLALQSETGVKDALELNLATLRETRRAEKDKMLEGKKKVREAMKSLTPEQIEALINGNN